MKKLFYAAVIVIAALSSCATKKEYVETARTLEYMESSARVLEPEHAMMLTPIIADLRVSEEKVRYEEKDMFKEMEITQAMLKNIVELKKIAISRAARAYNADVLVGTTIDVVTVDGRLEISVSGYPAYYTKFRNVKSDDVKLQKEVKQIKAESGTNLLRSPESTLQVRQVEVENK